MKKKDKMGKQEQSKSKKTEVRTFSGFLICINMLVNWFNFETAYF